MPSPICRATGYLWLRLRLGLIAAGALTVMSLFLDRGVTMVWARDAWPLVFAALRGGRRSDGSPPC